jgi:hypothetical protein
LDLKAVVDALDRLAYALHKDLWDKASVIGVCFTLVAVCYYTYETLRLRRAAQRQNEISIEPALAVYIREFAHGNPRQVVIENVGRGPAFNIEIRQPSSFWTITLRNNVIAPGRCEGLEFRYSQSLVLIDDFPAKMHNVASFAIIASCVGLNHASHRLEFCGDPNSRTIVYQRPART